MLYTFLISVVFISEIIIAMTLLVWLFRADRVIVSTDRFLSDKKYVIKDICELSKNLAFQLKELISDYVEEIIRKREENRMKMISKLLLVILFWKINKKILVKYKHLKFLRFVAKGLKLAKLVV